MPPIYPLCLASTSNSRFGMVTTGPGNGEVAIRARLLTRNDEDPVGREGESPGARRRCRWARKQHAAETGPLPQTRDVDTLRLICSVHGNESDVPFSRLAA